MPLDQLRTYRPTLAEPSDFDCFWADTLAGSPVGTATFLAGVIPGMRGVYGGRVRNAHQLEALTANLVAVNRRYRTHAGLRLTGV